MRTSCGALWVASMLAAASPWAAAQVYKCTDAAGKTTYQAQPCPDAKTGTAMNLEGQPAPRPRPAPAPVAPAFDDEDRGAAPRAPSPLRRSAPPERVEVPWVRISFDLLGADGRAMAWTNAGPVNRARTAGPAPQVSVETGVSPVAVSPNGREAYTLEGNGGELVWWPQGLGGPKQRLTPPGTLPRLSWGSALAWEPRSGVLAIVSQGGEGFFYRYDTRRHTWLGATPLRNRDLMGLAFDAQTGQYVGLSSDLDLVTYDAQGAQKTVMSLAKTLPSGVYNAGAPLNGALTLAAGGGAAALVRVSGGTVSHIWTCELAGGRMQLTYKD